MNKTHLPTRSPAAFLRPLLLLIFCFSIAIAGFPAPVTQAIKTDHFGYRPDDVKVAIFSSNPGSTVEVRKSDDTVVLQIPNDGGSIVSKGADGSPSGDTVWWVDFSILTTPGTYRLYIPTLASQSYDFEVRTMYTITL